MLREVLIRIRKEFNTNTNRFFVITGATFAVSLIVSFLLDALTPFSGVAMVARSMLLMPLGGSIFALGYVVSLLLHRARVREDDTWIPFRLRFSPSWRRRISLIVGAFLVVVMYSSGFRIGYTLTAGTVVAIVIALFAFMRTTREEAARESMNIPDSRDIRYKRQMKERERVREERKEARRNKNKEEEDEDLDD